MARKISKGSASPVRKMHRIRFVGPKNNVSMGMLAERLIELNLIEEAYVDVSENDFVAKVWFVAGRMPKYPSSYIAKYLSKDFGKVTSDYQYKR